MHRGPPHMVPSPTVRSGPPDMPCRWVKAYRLALPLIHCLTKRPTTTTLPDIYAVPRVCVLGGGPIVESTPVHRGGRTRATDMPAPRPVRDPPPPCCKRLHITHPVSWHCARLRLAWPRPHLARRNARVTVGPWHIRTAIPQVCALGSCRLTLDTLSLAPHR